LVDDEKHATIGFSNIKGKNATSGSALGKSLVEVCKKQKIKQLVFDRGGYRYHGVIKQIADTVREGGITI
jgi:large subunit ribosomal protein L18